VIGAARLVGQIGLTQAVPAVARLLEHPSAGARRAAVEALVLIKSGAALDALQKALEDSEREVRIAAARGLGSLRYQPARSRLEEVLQGKIVRDADLTEKIAFFEAFGSVANADSVAMLDKMLNGKSLLRKQTPELRACAAMALGKVGTPASRASLERAREDQNPMVRNAVVKAMRQETATA
jgi:HEAT repeat protein